MAPSSRTSLLTVGLRISLMPFLVPLTFSPFNSQPLIHFPLFGLLKMTLRASSSCCHPSKISSSISMLSSGAHNSVLSLMCLISVRTTKSDDFWKILSTMRPSIPTCSPCFSLPWRKACRMVYTTNSAGNGLPAVLSRSRRRAMSTVSIS